MQRQRAPRRFALASLCAASIALGACGGASSGTSPNSDDAGSVIPDSGSTDSGPADSGLADGEAHDTGASNDAGADADAASVDASNPDAEAGAPDAAPPEAGPPTLLSGGFTTVGPSDAGTATAHIVDNGFELGSRTCATGGACVTGGIVP